ncbi:hypothetical protein ACJRO7_027496, partial [Eucalyptus globulus]
MGELAGNKHVKYILSVEKKKDSFESVVMEHLRLNGAYWGLATLDLLENLTPLNGAYWGLTILDLLGKLGSADSNEVVSWILQCQHESHLADCAGGFGGNIRRFLYLPYTLIAAQTSALFDKLDFLDINKVTDYILWNKGAVRNEDGSFSGDVWGEVYSRFSHFAICCFAILKQLDSINVENAVRYIVSCKTMDSGFGCIP